MDEPPHQYGAHAEQVFVNPDTSTLRSARQWTRDVLHGPTADIELVVTELLTNAIQYGGPGTVSLSLDRNPAGVTIAVTNPAASPPPQLAVPFAGSPRGRADQERGRGLLIAAAIADEVRIRHDGEDLRVEAFVAVRPDGALPRSGRRL